MVFYWRRGWLNKRWNISMINLNINDKTYQFTKDSLLADVLKQTQQSLAGIAVAVNNHFIPQSEYAQTQLKDNDQIMIVTAMQGG